MLAVMQPYLFPYLGYFQLIQAVDTFVMYDNLDYVRRRWIDRNRLLDADGRPFFIRAPIARQALSRKIRDIELRDEPWRPKLLRDIFFNYRRSAYFEEVYPVLEAAINTRTRRLSRLNTRSLRLIADFLGIDTKILTQPDFDWLEAKLASSRTELKDAFPDIELAHPSVQLIRLIEICRSFETTTYVNPIGGLELYSRDELAQNGLEILFLRMQDVRYRQRSTEFVPNLSIIDALMHCGRDGTREMLDRYTLI